MKRLWPLPVFLLLALPLLAQEGDAPPEGEPAAEDAPLSEPGSSEEPSKEEPFISVKVVKPAAEEGDEESTAPAEPENKVTPTATIMKAPKKGKAASKKTKLTEAPAVVKTKAPVLAPEAPPPPVPAVPLTPITPRNP